MPSFEISTPNGKFIIDGAADEASALDAYQKQYGGGKLTSNSVVVPETPGRTFSEGFLRGVRDPIDAGAQMLTHGIAGLANLAAKAGVPGAATVGNYMTGQANNVDAINNKAETDYERTYPTTAAKIGRAVGNIGVTLPLFAEGWAETLPRAVFNGAKQGAVIGALQPVYKPGDFAAQKGEQALEGAAFAAPASGALGVVSKIVAPKATEAVKKLIAAGVKPTTGQILGGSFDRLEEAAQSIPFVGDSIRGARNRAINSFNTSAINYALAPIGEKLGVPMPVGHNIAVKAGKKIVSEAGHDAIAEADEKISNAYQSLVPQSGVVADQTFIQNVKDLLNNAQYMAPARRDQFYNIVSGKVFNKFSPGGGLTGESFKEIESDLGKLSTEYRNSSDADQRQLGSALLQLQQELRDQLARSHPDIADKLAATNEAYSRLLRVQGAASSIGAQNGVFSAAQLARSVRNLDPTLRKKAFAKGEAKMQDLADAGKEVLGDKVPDSGTPYRLFVNGAGTLSLAGLHELDPAAAAGVVGGGLGVMGAYSKLGQKIINPLLVSRPAGAAKAAAILRSMTAPRGFAAFNLSPNN